MKTKYFILAAIAFLLVSCKSAQQDTTSAAERKAINKAESELRYTNAVQALKDSAFVLEADKILFKYGNVAYVTSNTNFVSMNGNKVTVQLAFNSVFAGPNGIGGITLEGTVSNVKMNTDKKGNVNYSLNVMGTGLSATLSLSLTNGDNYCQATINPNFNSNRITFSGYLLPADQANIYKGRAL